jgi:hypothetical protein
VARGQVISIQSGLALEVCCNCGVEFGIPEYLQQKFMEDRRTFYCPNGHAQSYIGKTEAEKLREQLAESEKTRAALLKAKNRAVEDLDGALGTITKMKKRVKAGMCLECHRYFADVERHYKSKHGIREEAKQVAAEMQKIWGADGRRSTREKID